MILLDTHALIWWLNDPASLSQLSAKAIENAVLTSTVHVSAFTAWEITLLADRGRLQLTMDAREWLARCEAIPLITFVPVSISIASDSIRLPDFPHADPADRIIAATALHLGVPLVTKDEKLRGYKHLSTIW